MVFSMEDKAVIKNDLLEKGWNANRICTEHPAKNWNRVSVFRLLKRFQEDNSMERRPGSGRPRTVTTEENEDLVQELVCSQEDNPQNSRVYWSQSKSDIQDNRVTTRHNFIIFHNFSDFVIIPEKNHNFRNIFIIFIIFVIFFLCQFVLVLILLFVKLSLIISQ